MGRSGRDFNAGKSKRGVKRRVVLKKGYRYPECEIL